MPTPTEDDIIAVLKTKPDIELDSFIAYGEELYDDHCSEAAYADAKELKIKTLLACHLYSCLRDLRKSGSQVDSIRDDFQSKIDFGLSLTHHGQMAMMLDTEGGLANFNNAVFNQTPSAGVVSGGPSIKFLGSRPDRYGRRS